MEFKQIRDYEKIAKLIQYSDRFLNSFLNVKSLRYLYSSISFSRRLIRALRHFQIVRTIIYFYINNWNKRKKRWAKLIYYFCLYIFMVCDLIILVYKFKIFQDRKFLVKVFDFVDKVWIFQNTMGIVDLLYQIVSLKHKRNCLIIKKNELIRIVEADQKKENHTEPQLKNNLKKSDNDSNEGFELDLNFHKNNDSFDSIEILKKQQNEILEQQKKLLEDVILKQNNIEKQLVVKAKHIFKYVSEMFLAIGFMYTSEVGDSVVGLSGLFSALSVF